MVPCEVLHDVLQLIGYVRMSARLSKYTLRTPISSCHLDFRYILKSIRTAK